jgi:hypothetical protein
MVLGADGVGGV